MEFTEVVRTIGRNWILIVVTVIAASLVGWLVAATSTPTYTAESKVMLSAVTVTAAPQEQVQGNNLVIQQMGTYTALVMTPLVLQPTIDQLSLDSTPVELTEDITATPVEGTSILTITADGDDPASAAELADALAANFVAVISDPAAGVGVPGTIAGRVVQQAEAPEEPSSLPPVVIVAVAFAAGLVLALLLVVLREVSNTRVRNGRDLAKATGANVLGTIPRVRGRARASIRTAMERKGFGEAVRLVRLQLKHLLAGPQPVVAFTSPAGREGKTTVAAGVALALAEDGTRVTLVDANLRAPRLASVFGIPAEGGLDAVLTGSAPLGALEPITVAPGLDVLPTGKVGAGSSELLGSARMHDLVRSLSNHCDIVILDAGSAGEVADASELAAVATGFVMVVRAGRTRASRLRIAEANVRGVDSTLFGVVLDDVPTSGPDARA